jgi:hypothetical protein
VVLIAAIAMGTTLWVDREARGATAAGNPVLAVPIAGKVQDGTQSVSLSGEARVGTSVTHDSFGDPASVVISVDLSGIRGTDPSGKKYQASGEEHLVRPLQESDVVEVTFVYYPAGTDASSSEARSATVSFRLRLDLAHGALLKADAAVGSLPQ